MQIDTLAIFGGRPSFPEVLHVGRPNLGERERFLERVNDMWDRRWLSNHGPYVAEFERRIADMVGVKHCIAACNGTIALEIAIRALGLTGEVIIPSFTFIATAHALQWQEITPVFCDIGRDHNLDPAEIERHVTPRTAGIVGVHLWGRPCNVDALEVVAKRHDLKLMFDASHAFGCSHNGAMIGSFGDIEVFSFHATKFINAFEGGALVTNSDELARKARWMKNFGFSGYDRVDYVGTNGKMTEVAAAMGLTSLESMAAFVDHNRVCYHLYDSLLSGIPGLKLIRYNEQEHCNYQYVVIEVDETVTGISRDQIVRVLHAENVLARRYFHPGCHGQEPYRSYYPNARLLLPETERLAKSVFALPTGTAIDPEAIGKMTALLCSVVQHGHRIAQRLDTEPESSRH